MSEDPAHKAMLYFLEILMNSNGPLTISQLAGRFGSRTFSPDMRLACGGNEQGLKKFLMKYPSLFTVKVGLNPLTSTFNYILLLFFNVLSFFLQGNNVSLFDGKSDPEYPQSSDDDSVSERVMRRRSLPDVSVELDAVSFFQVRPFFIP